MGELDPNAKSVGATMVMQIDPERAKQMREMQANYGKTWIMGKVTAIDGVKVTLMGTVDNAAHTFVADENTTFRKRRDPITLADIQLGDMVRAEGGSRTAPSSQPPSTQWVRHHRAAAPTPPATAHRRKPHSNPNTLGAPSFRAVCERVGNHGSQPAVVNQRTIRAPSGDPLGRAFFLARGQENENLSPSIYVWQYPA